MARPRAVEEIEVTVVAKGNAALLVRDGSGTEAWVPHSLIDDESEITADSTSGEEGILVLPRWKAEELALE